MTPKKKILDYCQSLVGVVHRTCGLRIIDALRARGIEVDLIYGGLDAAMPTDQPGLRTLRLPTLLHDEDSGEFFSPDGGNRIAAIWDDRAHATGAFLQMPCDAIVVQFYPFGRRFKNEIVSLFSAVRDASGPVPISTSVREVLAPRATDNERRMVASVRKHIHIEVAASWTGAQGAGARQPGRRQRRPRAA